MDLSNLTNIMKINYEDTIRNVIKDVREEYKDLSTDRTCFLYSSLVHDKLKEKHIISRIISTIDLGIDYEHRFVLVKDKDKYYLIDLTYRQFFNNVPQEFIKLDHDGYQLLDRVSLIKYLGSFSGKIVDNDIDNLFFK